MSERVGSSERAAIIGCVGVIIAAIISGVFLLLSSSQSHSANPSSDPSVPTQPPRAAATNVPTINASLPTDTAAPTDTPPPTNTLVPIVPTETPIADTAPG